MSTRHHIDVAPKRKPNPATVAELLLSQEQGDRPRAQWRIHAAFHLLDEIDFVDFIREILEHPTNEKKLDAVLTRTTGRSLARWVPYETDVWVPSLQEIADECRRIRAGWSSETRRTRWVMSAAWTVPQVRLSRRAAK